MKKALYILILILLVAGCNEKVIEKPEDLISKDKMVDILYDLSLINAAKAINPSVIEENQIEPMSYIYTKYEIDSAQFAKSDLYYAAIPLEYEAIYKAVDERIEAEKTRLEEERDKQRDTTGYKEVIKPPLKSKE